MNDDDSLIYDAPFAREQRNNSHVLAFEFVLGHTGRGTQVLDIGCGTGAMSAALRAEGRVVTGVEPHAAAAARARQRLAEVHTGTAEDFFAARPQARFDAIVFADVLEHIADPGATLARAARALAPGGVVVASVPNITHASVRAMLIEGRWDMADRGILDRTHLRFFSLRALVDLFSSQALAIQALAATTVGAAEASRDYGMGLSARAIAWAEASAADDSAATFQHVLCATPAADAADAARCNAGWTDGSRRLLRPQPVPRAMPLRRRVLLALQALRRPRADAAR